MWQSLGFWEHKKKSSLSGCPARTGTARAQGTISASAIISFAVSREHPQNMPWRREGEALRQEANGMDQFDETNDIGGERIPEARQGDTARAVPG